MSFLDKAKWGSVLLLAILLLVTYGSVSLQLIPLSTIVLEMAPRLGLALLFIVSGKVLLHITKPILVTMIGEGQARETARRLWSLAVWGTASILALATIAGGFGSLLLSVGLLSLAVAIAFQKPILSLAAWLRLTTGRLYEVGDRIAVGSLYGDVIAIDLLTTTIIEPPDSGNPPGRVLSFPNGLLFEQPVVNFTKGSPYVWDEITVPATVSDYQFVRNLLVEVCDEVIGNRKMAGNAGEHSALLKQAGLAPGFTELPEISIAMNGSRVDVRMRYLVNVKIREATRAALYERLLRELGGSMERTAPAYARAAVRRCSDG